MNDYHTLTSGTVHLWHGSLLQSPAVAEQLAATLSTDELTRAERFKFERHQRRFKVGRGMLRQVLAQYLACAPHEVQFEYGHQGKPKLAPAMTTTVDLRFNLSHSVDMALLGITCQHEIGVDIECLDRKTDYLGIAERFFSPQEQILLAEVSPAHQSLAFFNGWTRKEAFVKAVGEGLALPLDLFDVELRPNYPARLLDTRGKAQVIADWSLRAVPVEDGFVGALAVMGKVDQVENFTWHSANFE